MQSLTVADSISGGTNIAIATLLSQKSSACTSPKAPKAPLSFEGRLGADPVLLTREAPLAFQTKRDPDGKTIHLLLKAKF